MAKYYDFDKFMKESEKEKIGMKVKGKVYYLPEIKASLVMGKLMKLASAKTDEEKASMLDEDTMKDVVGSENYEAWIEEGISMKNLKAIVFVAMQLMGEGLSEEVDINSIEIVDDKKKVTTKSVNRLDILEDWSLIEADFQREYSINLVDEFSNMTWRRFQVLLRGLSPISRMSFKTIFSKKEIRNGKMVDKVNYEDRDYNEAEICDMLM